MFKKPSPAKTEENLKVPTQFVLVHFGKTPGDIKVSQLLFRGDGREPAKIFAEGFTARGTNANVLSHVYPIMDTSFLVDDSAFIATSRSKEVAVKFPLLPKNEAFIYEINAPKSVVDIETALKPEVKSGRLLPEDFEYFKAEKEMVVPRRVKATDIKGAWPVEIREVMTDFGTAHVRVEHVRTIKDTYIPNPQYCPPGSRLLIAAKAAGHGMMAVGATLDALSLHQAYQDSDKSGNYDIFFREGARIIGGWSGAAAVGIPCAIAGAAACSFLGPGGAVVGGFAGGVAGSIVGYAGGEEMASEAYNFAGAHLSAMRTKPMTSDNEPPSPALRSALQNLKKTFQSSVVSESSPTTSLNPLLQPGMFDALKQEINSWLTSASQSELGAILPNQRMLRSVATFMILNAYDISRDIVFRESMALVVEEASATLASLEKAKPAVYFEMMEKEIATEFGKLRNRLPPALKTALPKMFTLIQEEAHFLEMNKAGLAVDFFKQRVSQLLGVSPGNLHALNIRMGANVFIAAACAVPMIVLSDNPKKEAEHWLYVMAGGLLGAKTMALATAGPCSLTGAGAPVCTGAFSVVGGLVGMNSAELYWQKMQQLALEPDSVSCQQAQPTETTTSLLVGKFDHELVQFIRDRRSVNLSSALSTLKEIKDKPVSCDSLLQVKTTRANLGATVLASVFSAEAPPMDHRNAYQGVFFQKPAHTQSMPVQSLHKQQETAMAYQPKQDEFDLQQLSNLRQEWTKPVTWQPDGQLSTKSASKWSVALQHPSPTCHKDGKEGFRSSDLTNLLNNTVFSGVKDVQREAERFGNFCNHLKPTFIKK